MVPGLISLVQWECSWRALDWRRPPSTGCRPALPAGRIYSSLTGAKRDGPAAFWQRWAWSEASLDPGSLDLVAIPLLGQKNLPPPGVFNLDGVPGHQSVEPGLIGAWLGAQDPAQALSFFLP